MAVQASILKTIREACTLPADDPSFDGELILHINSVIFELTQLGVKKPAMFTVTGDTETWTDYLPDGTEADSVKSYMGTKVKLMFDMPTNSFLITAIKDQLDMLAWRIREQFEPGGANNG